MFQRAKAWSSTGQALGRVVGRRGQHRRYRVGVIAHEIIRTGRCRGSRTDVALTAARTESGNHGLRPEAVCLP